LFRKDQEKRMPGVEALLYAAAALCWFGALLLPDVLQWPLCMGAVLFLQSGLIIRGEAPGAALAVFSAFSGRAAALLGIAGLWVAGMLFPPAGPWVFSAGLSLMAIFHAAWGKKPADSAMQLGRDSGEDRESQSDKTRKSARNG
jgi:hypothetical protein